MNSTNGQPNSRWGEILLHRILPANKLGRNGITRILPYNNPSWIRACRLWLSIAPCITSNRKEALNTTVVVLLKNVSLNLIKPLEQGFSVSPLTLGQIILCCVGDVPTTLSCNSQIFSSISGFYLPDASIIPVLWKPEMSQDIVKCLLEWGAWQGGRGRKSPSVEGHCSRFNYQFTRNI